MDYYKPILLRTALCHSRACLGHDFLIYLFALLILPYQPQKKRKISNQKYIKSKTFYKFQSRFYGERVGMVYIQLRSAITYMSAFLSYFRQIFRVNLPQGKIQTQAYEEITRSLNKAFALPSLRQYLLTLNTRGLLVKAVEMFVGSRAIPKNIELSRYLMELAQSKAKDPKQLYEIQYYKYFFVRIDAFKQGKTQQFDMTTQAITQLAEEHNHPQSCYLTGKQIYNIAINTEERKQRIEMYKLAIIHFQKSLVDEKFGGLYYIGQILRQISQSEAQKEEILEMFTYGAAYGDPLCYFRMSQHYLKTQNKVLYLKYLKMAAEAGVIQAQHNLGCEYVEGVRIGKDEVKGLSWFLHAGANGFVQSKFNIVHLFLNGSSCGRIKPNRKVALLKLQELKNQGHDVQKKISEIVESEEIKSLLKEQNQGITHA